MVSKKIRKKNEDAKKGPRRTMKRSSRTVKRTAKTAKSPDLDQAISEFQDTVTSGGVARVLSLSDDDCLAHVKMHISTGSISLDSLCNGKGIPTGRLTEIFGPEHVGKSTILDQLFGQVQRLGGMAVCIDTDSGRDEEYTKQLGVDTSKLQMVEFDRGELHIEHVVKKALESVIFWSQYDIPVVIGVDAIGSTSKKKIVDSHLDDVGNSAEVAKFLRDACRLIPQYLSGTKIALVFCNHQYQTFSGYKETYGGGAIRLLSTLRIQLRNSGDWIAKSDGEVLGRVIVAKLIKNKLGRAWAEARLGMVSGSGTSNVYELFEILKKKKLMAQSASWNAIDLDGEVIKFQGWHGLASKCAADPELFPRLVSAWKASESTESRPEEVFDAGVCL